MPEMRAEVASRIDEIAAAAGARRGDAGQDGLASLLVERDQLRDLLVELRDDPLLEFKLCLDVTAVDWSGQEPRFELVYHFYSVAQALRLRVKTRVTELDARVPSVTDLFPGADFHEREAFDMFGIVFDGHPDLRRILLPDEYEHHPLRKEFPLEGIEPEKVYRMQGNPMLERPAGAEAIRGAGSSTP